jgi:hypothetical protein
MIIGTGRAAGVACAAPATADIVGAIVTDPWEIVRGGFL